MVVINKTSAKCISASTITCILEFVCECVCVCVGGCVLGCVCDMNQNSCFISKAYQTIPNLQCTHLTVDQTWNTVAPLLYNVIYF